MPNRDKLGLSVWNHASAVGRNHDDGFFAVAKGKSFFQCTHANPRTTALL
jgi:hypothetical protein